MSVSTFHGRQGDASRPLRILHVGKYFPPYAGGMENFLGDLVAAQRRRGMAVGVLVHEHRPPAERGESANAGDIPIWRAPSHGRLLYAPVSPLFPLFLARAIREFRPDILHLHLPNTSAFWALLLPAARRLPWVVHWHSDVVSSQIDRALAAAYRFYRPFEQTFLRRAARVIATSDTYLRTSTALAPWREKCRVVSLGIDPARIKSPAAEDLAWADKRWGASSPRILAIGRLTYYKGHDVLIRALARIPHARLLIVGSGEREERLRAVIAEHALEGRVKLIGGCPQGRLTALLAGCDIFCLPSVERTEAFGVVLLEAMRFARPVVASDIPGSGATWVVQNGETGLLVPPGDPEALAAALQKLADAPDLRASMGEAGQRRFQELFHTEAVAGEIVSVYDELPQPGAGSGYTGARDNDAEPSNHTEPEP